MPRLSKGHGSDAAASPSAAQQGVRRAAAVRAAPGGATVTRARAGNIDEAEAAVSGLYLPNRLERLGDAGALALELAAVRVGSTTVGRLTYGGPIRLITEEASHFHVNT